MGQNAKIPCKFPYIREIPTRDMFAADCAGHHSLPTFMRAYGSTWECADILRACGCVTADLLAMRLHCGSYEAPNWQPVSVGLSDVQKVGRGTIGPQLTTRSACRVTSVVYAEQPALLLPTGWQLAEALQKLGGEINRLGMPIAEPSS